MISIICSTYNSSEWINNYLKYLNEQTLPKFEVIFVDANSSDSSLQTIKDFEFREGIEKVVVEEKERVNIYKAWNTAINQSRYEYVMNYNTDDKLFPPALERFVTYIQEFPDVDVIVSNCMISSDSDHEEIVSLYNWPDANDLQTLLNGCCCGPFPVLKKSKVLECGGFDEDLNSSGDYEMWCRMNVKGALFGNIEKYLGVYFHNPQGVSTDLSKREEHLAQDRIIRETYSRFIK